MRATTCFQGPTTRRRMSMGLDASMNPEEDRDPEGQVDDYDELIRYAHSLLLRSDSLSLIDRTVHEA